MDIDGGEYGVIPGLLTHSQDVIAMIVEFHDAGRMRKLFEQHVKSILESFSLVHLHGNNFGGTSADGLPEVLELTFVSKRYACSQRTRDTLPLPGLDFPNNMAKADFQLRFPTRGT
jgi:hypothetical protein